MYFNHPTKSDLKKETGINTNEFAKKTDLEDIDKKDIDKLKTVFVDLSKLSDVVGNEVAKNTIYVELIKKVNTVDAIYLSCLVKKNFLQYKN